MTEGKALEDFISEDLCCLKTSTMIALFFFKNILMTSQVPIGETIKKFMGYISSHAMNISILYLASRQVLKPLCFSTF